MLRLLAFLLTCALCAEEAAPDVAALRARLQWRHGSLAEYERLFAQAEKAGVNELDLLIPRVEAYMLFGDVARLRDAYKKAVAEKAKILRRLPDNDPSSVQHSLKVAKKLLDFAKARPDEVESRAAIYRNVLYAEITRSELESVAETVEMIAQERELKPGDAVPWEEVRKRIPELARLAETGATIFGDKLGPLRAGAPVIVPAATLEKLKPFVAADYFKHHLAETEARSGD